MVKWIYNLLSNTFMTQPIQFTPICTYVKCLLQTQLHTEQNNYEYNKIEEGEENLKKTKKAEICIKAVCV